MAHTLGIVHNYFFYVGAGGFEFQYLVGLLLIAGHDINRIRVVDDIFYFFNQAVLKEPYADSPGAKSGHFSPQPLGSVIANHGYFVPFLQTEANQTKG